jgi:hypothetical protein
MEFFKLNANLGANAPMSSGRGGSMKNNELVRKKSYMYHCDDDSFNTYDMWHRTD